VIIFRSAADARRQLHQEIPALAAADWKIKSPLDTNYQCIAWAACRTDRVWWPWDHPRFYWPPGFQKLQLGEPVPVDHFAAMFEAKFGYHRCPDSAREFGYQKVAIYANSLGVTHMARQHLLGQGWLSKLGEEEDILHHTLYDVEGPAYGRAVLYMKRSWWTALIKLCLVHSFWAAFKFWIYRKVVPWDLK
jgi:hypothetical protein